MNQRLLWALLSWLSLLSFRAQAQNLSVAETFENLSTDLGYTNNYITTYEVGPTVEYFDRRAFDANGSYPGTRPVLSNREGAYTWAGKNVRSTGQSNFRSAGVVITNPIANSQNFKGFVIRVAMAAPRGGTYTGSGADNVLSTDRIRIQYSFGFGSWVTAKLLMGNNRAGNGTGDFEDIVTLSDSVSVGSSANNVPATGGTILDQTYRDIVATLPAATTGANLRVRVVTDTRGPESAFDNIRITGVPDNTPKPTLTNIEPTAATYTEGSATPTQLTNSLLVGYSDRTNTSLTGATVSIDNFVQGQDVLNFSNQLPITGSFNPSTGILTLSGTASQAAYQTALRSVTYSNSNTTTATGGSRSVTFQVANGSTRSPTATRTLVVTAVLTAGALNYTENFDIDGEGTRYFGTPFVENNSLVGFFRATTSPARSGNTTIGSATFTGWSGGYWFGEGTDNGFNPNQPVGIVQLPSLNATGRTNIKFTLAVGAAGNWRAYFDALNPGDHFELFYRINGGALVKFAAFSGTGTGPAHLDADLNRQTLATGTQLSTTLRDFTFTLPAGTANVGNLEFFLQQEATGTKEIAFDNIRITGTALPTVTTTTPATNLQPTSATLGGTVTADGGGTLTERGVVYVAGTGIPTISNTKAVVATSGIVVGTPFSGTVTGLTAGTQYTARAYATNEAGTSYGASVTFTTATTITSILRASTNPTNASTVNYTVTFGAPVTGLTAANFSLSTTGTVSGTVGPPVAGAGNTTWTVPVNAITGSGTLTLHLANDANLSADITTTLPFAGETYTIDKAAPTVTSSVRQNPATATTGATSLTFRVTFSEAVTGITTSSFAFVTTTGSTIGTIASVATVSGSSGMQYDVTVNGVSGNGTVRLDVKNSGSGISDAVGNALSGGFTTGETYAISQSVTIASVTRLDLSPTATAQVSYRVVFSGSVTGLTNSNFTPTVTSGSISGASISSVSAGPGTTYTVDVSTGTGNGTLRLDVTSSTGTTPVISNAPYTTGEEYTITKSFAAAPTLRIQAAGSASGNGDVTAFVDVVQVLNASNGSNGSVVANGLQNGSFETNNVAANSFKKSADGVVAAPWVFTGTAGVTRNNNNTDFTPPTPPNGDAVSLVQSAGNNNASLSQNLAVPTGTYQVNFQTAQRNYTSRDQRLNVFVNDVFVGNIQPVVYTSYEPFASATFSVTAPVLMATVSTTSTSPTSTAPLPFSVTFSQSVSSTFTAADVTVAGGTVTSGSFSGSGAGPYALTVTPSGTGTVTVSLAAGVANDANNTYNSASNAVSVQYQPFSLSGVSPAAELPGQVVTLTGTGFTSASTVSFGSTAASVTMVSATTLTATVPAGLSPGIFPVSVSTGGSTTLTQSFTVLAVYDGGNVGACAAAVPATASVGDGAWHYLLSTGGQVVAAYRYSGASLGTLALEVLRADPAQPVRKDAGNRAYLDRNWHLTNSAGRFDGRIVALRLYGLNREQARLQLEDPTATLTNLKAIQYSGPNEDCDLANNSPIGERRMLPAPAASPANTAYFVAELAVADHFSEFYLTGTPTPLPVELTAFTATAEGNRAVRLAWATASEKNNDRFEVERSADGFLFMSIGTLAAAGSSSAPRRYELLDGLVPADAARLYYRLRQVDLDGTFYYSPVRTVALTGAAAELVLYPNPAAGGAATLTGAQPGAVVTVLDALGRPVTSATADALGTATLRLPAGLTGVYVVRAGSHAIRLTVK
jgi:hypothetical protein